MIFAVDLDRFRIVNLYILGAVDSRHQLGNFSGDNVRDKYVNKQIVW